MTENQQSLASMVLFMALVLASLDASSNPFQKLEQQILDAEGFSLTFEISSEGAVISDLSGKLALCQGNKISIQSYGELFGESVKNSLQSDGQIMNLNGVPQALPPNLNEAVIIGLLRMGLLHNLVRLSGNLVPDHARGGVAEWVRVPVVGESSDKLFFDILIAGNRAGRADLVLSDDGLPLARLQTVYFGSEEMAVKETYKDFSLSCRL